MLLVGVFWGDGFKGAVLAVVVEGKKGSEKGWTFPGLEEEVAGEGLVSVFVVGWGGVDGAAFGVDGTVATVRVVVLIEGVVCRPERRAISVRRQPVQIMIVEILKSRWLQEQVVGEDAGGRGSDV